AGHRPDARRAVGAGPSPGRRSGGRAIAPPPGAASAVGLAGFAFLGLFGPGGPALGLLGGGPAFGLLGGGFSRVGRALAGIVVGALGRRRGNGRQYDGRAVALGTRDGGRLGDVARRRGRCFVSGGAEHHGGPNDDGGGTEAGPQPPARPGGTLEVEIVVGRLPVREGDVDDDRARGRRAPRPASHEGGDDVGGGALDLGVGGGHVHRDLARRRGGRLGREHHRSGGVEQGARSRGGGRRVEGGGRGGLGAGVRRGDRFGCRCIFEPGFLHGVRRRARDGGVAFDDGGQGLGG